MRSTLIYDLPTRIFHWLFSGLFLLSFIIGKTVDDDSVVFSYHMLSGMLLGGLVLWRLFWGLFGSQHARFTGFDLNPLSLKDYFLGIVSGSKKRWPGHNPASSWAAIIMFLLALGLAATGYLMSSVDKEAYEDIHEFMANTFIVLVMLHVSGVILHVLRHRDAIALSMIDGKKELSDSSAQGISSSRGLAAAVLLALFISSGFYILKNFNTQSRTLHVFGQTLQLGENKSNEKSEPNDAESNDAQENTTLKHSGSDHGNDGDKESGDED